MADNVAEDAEIINHYQETGCQTLYTADFYRQPYSIKRFKDDDDNIRYLTGFKNYDHLTFLYSVLLPEAESHVYKS